MRRFYRTATKTVLSGDTIDCGRNAAGNETLYMDEVKGEPISSIANEKVSDELILGLYKVMDKPIKGGFGSVQRVYHTQWNVDLAMKQPHAKFYQNSAHKQMFIDECEAWINLGLASSYRFLLLRSRY